MKRVVLCEKPDVARSIADGLSKMLNASKSTQGGGAYIDVGEYAVTWAYGHMFQLDIEATSGQFSNDSVYPKKWVYVPSVSTDPKWTAKTKQQIATISQLLKASSEIIIATDPGREGELIARLIMQETLSSAELASKKLARFWTSESVDAGVVAKHFPSLRDGHEFDTLFQEALARQHADFLVGIYLSRTLSTAVGRVQTPTLGILVDRELAIRDFKPVDYSLIDGFFAKDGFEYAGRFQPPKKTVSVSDDVAMDEEDSAEERQKTASGLTKAEATQLLQKMSAFRTGVITKVDKSKRSDPPPLLHSITSAQIEANKRYGFSGEQTMRLLQSLYETHKVLSYPRTESNYLATGNYDLVASALTAIGRGDLMPSLDITNKRLFNDEKLTDHHALIPLKAAPASLTADERKVYDIVASTFVAALYPNAVCEVFTITTTVDKQFHFITKGTRDLLLGWKEVLQKNSRAYAFDLKEGAVVDLSNLKQFNEQTKPPSRFTEATLLKVMANAHLLLPPEEKELRSIMKNKDIAGLGTGATRAGIIQNVIQKKNVEVKGKQLVPTLKGMDTIRALCGRCEIQNPIMTAKWEDLLAQIRSGSTTYALFIDGIKKFVDHERESIRQIPKETLSSIRTSSASTKTSKAKCPDCGGSMLENKALLVCTSQTCGTKVWKTTAKKALTATDLVALCAGKKIYISGYTSKAGKTFSAWTFYDKTKKGLAFDFDTPPPSTTVSAKKKR